jgi:hypothetical protein
MLNRLFASALLVAVLTMFVQPVSVSAAPKGPPGPRPLNCMLNGSMYPHGSFIKKYFYNNEGVVLYYDVYECVDGRWVYRWSSDDKNP